MFTLNTLEMNEDFLQFIWEHKLFHHDRLVTVGGEKVEVLSCGIRNRDSGPDFFNARIRLDDTIWAGNLEIHKCSSDWKKHRHDGDAAYENIILHVVAKYDLPVLTPSGEEIPALVLSYPSYLLGNYEYLLASGSWIPCQDRFYTIDPFVLKIGFNRLMVERLQAKTAEISCRIRQNQYDWNETFYQFLARNFGFRINGVPFEMLARATPLSVIGKHADSLFQVEAILFGQSGLLNEELLGDDYFLNLRDEYGFLMKKYNLRTVPGHLWKFLRLRPINFPTVRIAQFAMLLSTVPDLFPFILNASSPETITRMFRVRASEYWDRHYKFSFSSRKKVKYLGIDAICNLIINTIVPFLFVFGDLNGKQDLKDKALDWLAQLPPESNSVITNWKKLGVHPESAFETQALLQLKSACCEKKLCISCHVGNRIIRYDPKEVQSG
jgi:hypothetical protein